MLDSTFKHSDPLELLSPLILLRAMTRLHNVRTMNAAALLLTTLVSLSLVLGVGLIGVRRGATVP